MTVHGYARVSSERQSPAVRVAERKAAGCQRVFQEKISGVLADRKQLARLVAGLAIGYRDRDPAGSALKRVEAGEPLRDIALSYTVDRSTISRLKVRHAAQV